MAEAWIFALEAGIEIGIGIAAAAVVIGVIQELERQQVHVTAPA